MHPEPDQTGALVAAAEALRAGRAAARRLASPACDPLRREDFPDPNSLARRLSENGALSDAVARDVAALLSRCDALIGQGTTERTKWMPKAVCGEDVTEWEPRTRLERTSEAEAPLRRFLARRAHVADLVSAEAALSVLREGRASE